MTQDSNEDINIQPNKEEISVLSSDEVALFSAIGSAGGVDGTAVTTASKDILITAGYGNTINQLSQLDFKHVKATAPSDLAQPQDSETKVTLYPYGERVSGDSYDSPVLVIGGTWNGIRYAPSVDYISNASSQLAPIWIHPRTGKIEATIFSAPAGGFNNLTLTANADGFSISGGTASRTLTVISSNGTLNLGGLTFAITGANKILAGAKTTLFLGGSGSDNLEFNSNADGFSLTGGTSIRTFALTGGNLSFTSGNTNPTVTIPNTVTSTALVNTSSFTQYGVVFSSSATNGITASTAQGASGQPLVGAGASNPVFGNVNLGSYATGTLGISNGGTGLSTAPTLGQLLWGNNSSGYTLNTLAVTSPITIANNGTTGQGTVGINAASANTASYVVQRDGSGNFAAGTITASSIILTTGTISTTPSSATDIVNKAYVDAFAQGVDVRASCRLATTAALPAHGALGTPNANSYTASGNGALTVDSVAVALNDRILVKNEGAGTSVNNGIFYVADAGSVGTPWVLTRATDADISAEVTAGMFTFIEEGTINADSGWILITNNPITINSTALTFNQFTGAGSITTGSGLNTSGSTIAANIYLDNSQASNQIRFQGGSGSNNSAAAGNSGTSVTFDVKTSGSGTILLEGVADGFELTAGATGRKFTLSGGPLVANLTGTLTLGQSGTLNLGGFTLAVTGANKTLAGTKTTLTLGGSGTDGVTINTNADGFDISAGTSSRTLTVTGSSGTLTLGGFVFTVSGANKTLAGTKTTLTLSGSGTDNLTLTTNTDGFSISGGTTSRTLTLTSGGNLTFTSGSNNPNITIPNTATATAVVNTSSFTQYGVVFSSSATNGITASTAQGASGQPLIGAGAGNPTFGNVDIGTYATGVLPIANGGTNNGSLSVTNGRILYGGGSSVVSLASPTATANAVLYYAAVAPAWTGTTTTPGLVLQSQASTPQWANLVAGGSISAGTGINITSATPAVVSIDQTFAPTWTGLHIFRGSGAQITVQDSADSNVAKFRIDMGSPQGVILGKDITSTSAIQPFPIMWMMQASGTLTAKTVVKLSTTAGAVVNTGSGENNLAVGVLATGNTTTNPVKVARVGRVTVTADTTAVTVGDYLICGSSGQVTGGNATPPASGGWVGRALTAKAGGSSGDVDMLLDVGGAGSGGTVGGTGTQYNLTMFNNAGGTTIGNSMVTQNSGSTETYIGSGAATNRLVIGGATSASAITLNSNGQTTAAYGISFGTDANLVTLYRSANDTLKTDDNFIVTGTLSAGATGFTTTANGNATITPQTAGNAGLTIKTHATDDNSASVNFLEMRDSSNTLIARFNGAGRLLSPTKSFDIPHPSKDGWRLEYGCLEGPEYGVYDRGEACGVGEVYVLLKDYWADLTTGEYTLSLVPHGPYHLYVTKKTSQGFWIKSKGLFSKFKKISFDWMVTASRKDYFPKCEYQSDTLQGE